MPDVQEPTPVRVKEVETTTVACMHETETILLLIHLVASLEQVLDLKSVGFEDVVGSVKAYEEKIRDAGGDEQRLMLTRVSGGGGSFNGGRYGAGSSNGAGGVRGDDGVDEQQVMLTRARSGDSGAGSSRDGRNTGGGGVNFGVSGSLSRGKGKNRGEFTRSNGDGGSSSGSSGRGGVFCSGFPGSSRGMKGKWGRNNSGVLLIKMDPGQGIHQVLDPGQVDLVLLVGQKPKVLINPTATSPNNLITKEPLARIKFKEMRSLIGIKDISRRT